MEIRIRDAGEGDRDLIVRFNLDLARETEGKALDAGRLRAGVERLLADPSRGRYFLAEVESRVVGSTMITHEWTDWRDGWFWWIQSVWVEPTHRRRGVFAELYAHVERLAHDDPDVRGLRLYVEGDNQRAQDTYAALGMRMTGYRVMESEFARPDGEADLIVRNGAEGS
jgi:ribosomal protein S18 acetylase RimI-like enzyme